MLIIIELLAAGVNANISNMKGTTPLHLACQKDYRMAKELLAAGADANIPDLDGRTSLHHACSQVNAEIVQILIDAGADTMAKDNQGKTAWDLTQARASRGAFLNQDSYFYQQYVKVEEIFRRNKNTLQGNNM